MKLILVALLVAAVSAVPLPEDSNAVQMIVNGVVEGEALDIGDILNVKVNEHANGEVIATDLLHPYTAVGIAEANIPAQNPHMPPRPDQIPEAVLLPAPEKPVVEVADIPAPIVLPPPVAPVVEVPKIPEPVFLPPPPAPPVEIPEPVLLPEPAAPEVVPEPIYLPNPDAPEVEELPSPVGQGAEVYNDGSVSVNFNGPEEAGMMSTLSSWFNMVVNYFNQEGAAASDQIV